jgi:DNA polymerase III subunit delta'
VSGAPGLDALPTHPWQEAVWTTLGQRLTSGRLAHGQLLSGPQGLGKFAFAEAFARRLLCLAPGPNRVCGQCKGCHLSAAGNHPDLLQLRVGAGKQGLGIEAIRGIPGFLALKPHYGGHRIAVLEAAERMTRSAANALLKTLEEPPDGAYLLLVANRLAQVPITLRSRCQHLRFVVPKASAALAWLTRAEPDVDPRRWPLLLALAGGAPLRACTLAAESLDQRYRELTTGLLALRRGERGAVEFAQPWAKEPRALLGVMIQLVEDLLRQSGGQPAGTEASAALASSLSPGDRVRLHDYLARLYRLEGHFDEALNGQLLVEDLLIAWRDALH